MFTKVGEWLKKGTSEDIKKHLKRAIEVAITSLKLNINILLVLHFDL